MYLLQTKKSLIYNKLYLYYNSKIRSFGQLERSFNKLINTGFCLFIGNITIYIHISSKSINTCPCNTVPAHNRVVLPISLQILGYLTTKLEERTESQGISVSVDCVMEVIEEVVRQWPVDRLQVIRDFIIDDFTFFEPELLRKGYIFSFANVMNCMI